LYGGRSSKFRLRNDSRAFTLIELLVVVLIIGILAAIALPQYRFAVEKTHAAGMLQNVRALRDSFNRAVLAKGSNPSSWDELDITIPLNSQYYTYGSLDPISGFIIFRGDFTTVPSYRLSYIPKIYGELYPGFGGPIANKYLCDSYDRLGEKICLALGFTFLRSENSNLGALGSSLPIKRHTL
jgi:prepilin-type N-terminal cleavage/methylation domain-containing protein